MEKIEREVSEQILASYKEVIENYMERYESDLRYEIMTSMYNGASLSIQIEKKLSPAKTSQLRKNFQLLITPGVMTNYESNFDLYFTYNINDAMTAIKEGRKIEEILKKIAEKIYSPRFLKNFTEIIREKPRPFNKW